MTYPGTCVWCKGSFEMEGNGIGPVRCCGVTCAIRYTMTRVVTRRALHKGICCVPVKSGNCSWLLMRTAGDEGSGHAATTTHSQNPTEVSSAKEGGDGF
jgi:hypothetical protein